MVGEMFLVGAILESRVRILIDIGSTHIIEASFTRLAGLTECHIDTPILISNKSRIACRGACFNIPLRVDNDTFWIDDFSVTLNYRCL